MSKSGHPIILKKSNTGDSQRSQSQRQKAELQQPKILTKSSAASENTHQQQQPQQPVQTLKRDAEPQSTEVQAMKTSHRFLVPHFTLDPKAFDFLDNDNADFLVVAAIGAKNVGKSTLMNIIADQEYVRVHENSVNFSRTHEIFATRTEQSYEGSTAELFITTDRVFVLDTSPLAHNVQRRDMIVAEGDDLKLLVVLLQICHLLVVVHGGALDLTLMRLLALADSLVPHEITHRPRFVYVANNTQPGVHVRAFDDAPGRTHLTLPSLRHPTIGLHHDVQQVIQDYQEQVFMLKRYSLLGDDGSDEVFNERKWAQRVTQAVEAMKGDYFLRKYDALRDKYHQAVDN